MNKTRLLKAAPVIEQQVQALKKRADQLRKKDVIPRLDVFLVGNNPASVLYTNKKREFCQRIGAQCNIIKLDEQISTSDFLAKVKTSAENNDVHGMLIQLPLPKPLQSLDVATLVPAKKDVDGFHPENIFKLYSQNKDAFSTFLKPCTPQGIMELLGHYHIEVANKNVLIMGRSAIVGKPAALMALAYDATVTISHSHTQNLKSLCHQADIIISATGRSEAYGAEYLRESADQVLIDVGINKNSAGKTCGDWKHSELQEKLAAYTPVPGGVGPMTVLALVQNLLQATENQLKEK